MYCHKSQDMLSGNLLTSEHDSYFLVTIKSRKNKRGQVLVEGSTTVRGMTLSGGLARALDCSSSSWRSAT